MPSSEMSEYTPIVEDLIDNLNQSDDSFHWPSDEVFGYNLHQIQNSLDDCRDIDCWEGNLRDNYINSTEDNLDKLFDYVRSVRNNNLTHPCY